GAPQDADRGSPTWSPDLDQPPTPWPPQSAYAVAARQPYARCWCDAARLHGWSSGYTTTSPPSAAVRHHAGRSNPPRRRHPLLSQAADIPPHQQNLVAEGSRPAPAPLVEFLLAHRLCGHSPAAGY